jgi:hypothetical protein
VRRTEATLVANDTGSFLHCYRVFATADAEIGAELNRITVPALALRRHVGTPQGLAGYIADLHTLGIADGVTLIPVRAADSAQRIINDVLPMLGVDAARLAA